MNPPINQADMASVLAFITIMMTLGGLIWHAATLAQKVQSLIEWRTRHEPTAVELAEVKAIVSAQTGQLADIRQELQRLFDRGSRRQP